MEKPKLYGFNNLTKTLSFNIYDVCYTESESDQMEYIEYIDEQYNSDRLTDILKKVTEIIGANILNISKQDYDPQGASVALLISEEPLPSELVDKSCNCGLLQSETVVAHLDKSHVTVHTYPECHRDSEISTF
ncbi:MAG: S-adenosylmethionine decarboxylase, partial [Clostridiales bacterium]|nr:S-adenosylmethionine decarboxylase [Clostridiales bacterium]